MASIRLTPFKIVCFDEAGATWPKQNTLQQERGDMHEIQISFAVGCSFHCRRFGSAEVVRIAYIDPLSGPFAPQEASMLQHMQFVAERASREKWAGENKFEVVDFDNKGSPQESVSKLKAAINKHNELNLGNEIVYLNHSAQDPDMTNSKWL